VTGRLQDERGSVLVTAIILLGLMLGLGLTTLSFVDTETRMSGTERVRESSFYAAEQLLGAQLFILSRGWPGTVNAVYPSACTTGSTSTRCPDGTAIASRIGGNDLAAGMAWTTTVRDNGGTAPNFYRDATVLSQPTWDANADGKLWVRAQAVVHNQRRTLVGLVRVEQVTEPFPQNAITAGHFGTTNNGRKVIVDTKGTAAQAAPLAVRCLLRIPSCLDYSAAKGQVAPDTTTLGYSGGNALNDDSIDRLRDRAVANGTYYASGCPPNPSGALVFIETGDCSYNNSAGACCNTPTSPGILIINNGTLSLNGNIVFYGVVYAHNQQNSNGWVVSLNGTSAIQGSVAIDGAGGLLAGSSGVNVVYDPNAFSKIISYGNAGIIQNTWREITG
jgi:hypothetical protein